MIYFIRLIPFVCFSAVTFISCNEQAVVADKEIKSFVAPGAGGKGRLKSDARACYFDDVDEVQKHLEIELDTADAREAELMQSIMQYTGLPQNFKFYRGDVSNALSIVVDNQRFIIYNKDLFAIIDKMSDTYWSSVFILAHEIGHHLAYNISDTTDYINAELEADKFAASILFKMGADSAQALAAVKSRFISNEEDTKTHPSKSKRIEAVKKGWLDASFLSYTSAVPAQPLYTNPDYSFALTDKLNVDPAEAYHYEGDSIKNIKGIILKTEVMKHNPDDPMDPDLKLLLTILITETTSPDIFAITARMVFEAWYYNPYVGNGDTDFKSFFVPGRKITFDFMRACEHGDCQHIITRATGAN